MKSPFTAQLVGACLIVSIAKFEHVTHRTLVAPSGKYSLQATERFGLSFKMEDGEGKTLAPLDGDWKGELKSGVTALEITNEVIECESVDAVTGQPIGDTTTSFQDHLPAERIPLKPFFKDGTKAAREALNKIKLTPKCSGIQRVRGEDAGVHPQLGTLSGRFIYDGEPPTPTDLFPAFAKIEVSQPQQAGPDGRFSGVEAVYRDFLKHKIRPKTEDASLLVSENGGIANVVVWVVSKNIPWTAPASGVAPATIRLKDGNFSPRLAAVTVGQALLIENQDPVPLDFAAEFSRALNPALNVLLSPGTTPHRVTFRAPESYPATYRSNMAPWASGRVFVHGNPFVAVSQFDGSFTLPNLPTGDWEFQVWHERGGFVQHWPRGRFQQMIRPGDNSLGTIKLKPEHVGQKPTQAIFTAPPPQTREQIGQVLGRPVYRDEVQENALQSTFFGPVWLKYRDAHRAAITPTEDEINFAADYFDQEHRKRVDAEGGEAKIREQMKELEEQLARTDLPDDEQQKLELAHRTLRQKLKPPGRFFAEFMLNNWKFQKHLYDEFGGGRILWQQAGMEAFDAARACLESCEKQGEFKITDAKLRAKLFGYWTQSHGSFLTGDKERIRKEFLEPEWIKPAVGFE